MLNDLVMYQGKILRVGCISDYDIKIDLFEDGKDTPYAEIWQEELDEVKPIPLTSEILEKNGFVEQEYGWRKLNAANWCIYINIFNGKERYALSVLGINTQVTLHGYYVHELQHALRLCEIDKEIVL